MKNCTNKKCKQQNPQSLNSFRLDSKTKKYKAWCNSCSTEAVNKWRAKNPTKFKASTLKKYWPELTGQDSLKEYNKLLENQGYKCAICHTAQKDLKFALCVDHDHNNGQVRGLLCDSCNQALGLLKDDINALNRAIQYLK